MAGENVRSLLKTRNFGFVIGILYSAFFSLVGFSTGLFGNIEARLLDTFFSFKNPVEREAVQKDVWKTAESESVSPDILIVGIDLKALQRFGGWPFPRGRHADLVNNLSRIKNQDEREKSLLLDVFFIEESAEPENDRALAESMSESGRVFLESILDTSSFGVTLDEEMFARQLPLLEKAGSPRVVGGDWREMRPSVGLQTNLWDLNVAARGSGAANVVADDAGGVVRRQPLVFKYSRFMGEITIDDLDPSFVLDEGAYERLSWFEKNGTEHLVELPIDEAELADLRRTVFDKAPPLLYDADGDGNPVEETRVLTVYRDYFIPSITFSLALDYWNASFGDCEVYPGREIVVSKGDGSAITIPVDDQCAMIINFAGPASSAATDGYKTFPVRSYSGYSRETLDNAETWAETRALGGKIVLVGAFDKGMADDEKQTPYGMMFGIEIHANSLNTLLTGAFIRHLPRWGNVLLVFALTMLIALFAARMRNFLSLPLSLVLAIVTFVACSLVFDHYNILINYGVPFAGMLFTYVTIILYRSSTEEREKRRIRAMFGKYVSPEVVAQMMDHPPELGGVDRELTVFFSDIRGFTSLSETLTPQELVRHLNEYLSAMTDIILETGGTLDKYVGDEIMCFWGAPLEVRDHASRACRCALMQRARLEELNAAWPPERRLAIGIGINTGVMTVGNMGSKGRMNYTLMGDNVNLGARLEGTNKVYGTMIIVSEYTYAAVKDEFVFRELDTIRVKGKNRPVVIYELVDYRT